MAWAAIPHRLVDDVVGFPSRNRLVFRVHLGKILPERPNDLLAPYQLVHCGLSDDTEIGGVIPTLHNLVQALLRELLLEALSGG
jgi:hypothetical protein